MVLVIGIVLALIFRAVFIALGAAPLELFSFMFLIFGVALILTAVQLYRHRDVDADVQTNAVVRLARRVLPISDDYEEGRFVTRRASRRAVTPLFIVLLAIGRSDLLFGLDSIPAVFGVTSEPYIVFTANAFALLGLRALYFLVKGLLDRLVYLSTGLAVILAFIGVKLVLHWAHGLSDAVPEISTNLSLVVIVVVLTVTTVASLAKARRAPETRAHTGSLRARRPKAIRTVAAVAPHNEEPRAEDRLRRENSEIEPSCWRWTWRGRSRSLSGASRMVSRPAAQPVWRMTQPRCLLAGSTVVTSVRSGTARGRAVLARDKCSAGSRLSGYAGRHRRPTCPRRRFYPVSRPEAVRVDPSQDRTRSLRQRRTHRFEPDA